MVLDSVSGHGMQIHIEDAAIKEYNHNEMNTTCREGFVLPRSRGNLENCDEDLYIRQSDA